MPQHFKFEKFVKLLFLHTFKLKRTYEPFKIQMTQSIASFFQRVLTSQGGIDCLEPFTSFELNFQTVKIMFDG